MLKLLSSSPNEGEPLLDPGAIQNLATGEVFSKKEESHQKSVPEKKTVPRQSYDGSESLRYTFDLIWHLAQREFTLRYKGSVMGVLWVLAGPLTHLLMLVFVFKKVLPLNIDSYAAFVFTGLLPWTWFSSCIGSAGSLFTNNRELIRRPNFPPLVLITVNILSNLFVYLCVLPLVLVTLLFYNHPLTWALVLLPVLMLIQGVLIAGISLILATWNVFYRDIQQIAGIGLTLLFWITPVFYRSHEVAAEYQFLFYLNPMANVVISCRSIMFYGRLPDLSILVYALIISFAIAIFGYLMYRHQLDSMIDAL